MGRLGPVEWVMNTPSHHRVHHGSNVQYCDKNYAGTFIIWDRLFGTFEKEVEVPVYGIRHQLGTHNPLVATFHEWVVIARDLRQAKSLREVMGILFAAPGWKADGTGETTRQMQARAKAEEAAGHSACCYLIVMPRLDRGIHSFVQREKVDRPVKPGDDVTRVGLLCLKRSAADARVPRRR